MYGKGLPTQGKRRQKYIGGLLEDAKNRNESASERDGMGCRCQKKVVTKVVQSSNGKNKNTRNQSSLVHGGVVEFLGMTCASVSAHFNCLSNSFHSASPPVISDNLRPLAADVANEMCFPPLIRPS